MGQRIVCPDDTVGLVQIRQESDGMSATYLDMDNVPLPRREAARMLRILADQLVDTADRLSSLESP